MTNIEARQFSDNIEQRRNLCPHIIGVHHQLTYLPKTLLFLETLMLRGKRVMLELADYPNPRKYRINNSEFCEFFDAVAQGVMEKGGVVVAGDSEKLLNEAADKLAGLWAKSPLTYLCEWRTIISAKREPYFLEFVRKNKPDLVVLDHRHAEFVANGLKQNVFIID